MDPRNQHGNQQVGGQTDAYGKPIHGTTTAADDFSSNPQTQHHSNPLQQTHHAAVDGGAQQHGHQAQMVRPATQDPQGVTTLPRSGSGSSSSSEDDEMGGRRKKGLKEKIKEKLPGGHTATTGEHGQAQPTHGTTGHGGGTATTGGYGTTPTTGTHHPVAGAGEQHEKKGMMEKIKEKVPGGHTTTTGEHGQAQPTHGATGHGGGTTATGGYGTTPTAGTHQQPVGAAGKQHEKKGMMEKIKEKLPGGHQ